MTELLLSKNVLRDADLLRKVDDAVALLSVNPFEFHAASFFKLDLSIVGGMIAAMTTYLVLVIQFKITEEQFKANSGEDSASPQELDGSALHQVNGKRILIRA